MPMADAQPTESHSPPKLKRPAPGGKDEASNKRQKQEPPGPLTAPQVGPSQPQPQAGPSAPRLSLSDLSESQRDALSKLPVAQQMMVLQGIHERLSQPRLPLEATLHDLPMEEHNRLLDIVWRRLENGDDRVPTAPLEQAMYWSLQADLASIRRFQPKSK
ncbi:hypothetical protein BC835DRAFT_1384162 [Cytidiella melzeri]|nr:hypothetical protein BC835DRAFT_1384162 [Cytidiella melzeri]